MKYNRVKKKLVDSAQITRDQWFTDVDTFLALNRQGYVLIKDEPRWPKPPDGKLWGGRGKVAQLCDYVKARKRPTLWLRPFPCTAQHARHVFGSPLDITRFGGPEMAKAPP